MLCNRPAHTFYLVSLDKRRVVQLLTQILNISQATGARIDPENRRTRGDLKFKIPVRHFVYKTLTKCPLARGVWEWGDLPHETQQSTFKSLIKKQKNKITRPLLVCPWSDPSALVPRHVYIPGHM